MSTLACGYVGQSALERAAEAFDQLLACDPDGLTDDDLDEVITSAIRLGHRSDALARRVAPRWERHAVWAVGRFRNATGRLAKTANIPRREAGRVLAQGRQLLDMPQAAAALSAGEISIEHVERSKKALRADALVEMARRACATPPGGRRPRPLVTVAVGQAEFERLCELSDGTVITPGDLIPHLDALDVETMIFDGHFRAIEKSDARTFTGALRRAIEVRDRTCQHPDGCDAPIDDCDVDHIVPVYAGGQTTQDNGRLMCRFHNRIEPAYCTPPPPDNPDLDLRIMTPNVMAHPPPATADDVER